MPRQFVPFDDSYRVCAPVRVSRGVRCGDLLFMCGQMDLDASGRPRNRGDLMAQTEQAMSLLYDVMAHAGAAPSDLLHLHVFYLADSVADEAEYGKRLREMVRGDVRAVTVLTPLGSFPTEGAEVEIDGIAVLGAGDRMRVADQGGVVDGVRCGDLAFAHAQADVHGDRPGDVARAMRSLEETLVALDLRLADICKLTAYATGEAAQVAELGELIAQHLRDGAPVFTPMHLPTVAGGASVRVEAVASSGEESPERLELKQDEHWKWPQALPYAQAIRRGRLCFVGAQFPVNEAGAVQSVGDIGAQTHATMRHIAAALERLGGGLEHMTKVNAYFAGRYDQEDWTLNVGIRSSYYVEPGPASTGVEVAAMPLDGALIGADCFAVIDG